MDFNSSTCFILGFFNWTTWVHEGELRNLLKETIHIYIEQDQGSVFGEFSGTGTKPIVTSGTGGSCGTGSALAVILPSMSRAA